MIARRYHKLALATVAVACGIAVVCTACQGQPEPDDSTTAPMRSESTPAMSTPGPEELPRTTPASARAADVIRTRIAWKERASGDGLAPTATPRPPLEVIVEGDTVYAPKIALMWTRSAVGAFEHQDAESYCQVLEAAGFTDWRLPTIDELERLLDVDIEPPFSGGARVLWTSSPHEFRGFETVEVPGRTRSHQAVGVAHVICVRLHW